MTPETPQQTPAGLLPPEDWKAPVGWQTLFTSQELLFHPDKTQIYQRVVRADQLVCQAKTVNSHEPKTHEIQTTGLGIDWADVEHEAQRALGRKILGE